MYFHRFKEKFDAAKRRLGKAQLQIVPYFISSHPGSKAKDMADEQGAMASLSQQAARENAGTTSLGALLRAKLDNNEN
mgnify:CR=1 FL=1